MAPPSSAPERPARKARAWLVATALLAAFGSYPTAVHAMTVQSVEASYGAPTYRVTLVAWLDAAPPDVEAVLVDYPRYPQLDARIRASDVLATAAARYAVVRTRVRFCAAFFCRTIARIEEVRHGEGELVASVVPEASDLRQGLTRTTWRADGKGTLVSYSAEFTPDFWVPDMIARHYAAPALRNATIELFTNVEREANAR